MFSIQGISEKMLGPTTPPQVTYGLTEFGQDVAEPLTDLFDRITRRLPPDRRPPRDG
ncbi:hypothetical protein GCM10010302_30880 [Streptomyces polychromogenes]|uniref:HTH hxlR-type domain-containing protein n=1 Tax=Streptomyces polychromogenes TaxID=67342 RepID=A0ABN0VDP5_9ACTN